MSFRTIVVIGLAAVCGISAVAGVNQLRNAGGAGLEEGTVSVAVASTDLPRGVMVTKDCVKLVQMPKGDAPPDAVQTVEDALDRAVIIPLLKDDVVRDAKLG